MDEDTACNLGLAACWFIAALMGAAVAIGMGSMLGTLAARRDMSAEYDDPDNPR